MFQSDFTEDLHDWVETTRKLERMACDLIEVILRDPFTDLGKPELLKHITPGVWSRRLTLEQHTVYPVRDERLDFLQVRCHNLLPPTIVIGRLKLTK